MIHKGVAMAINNTKAVYLNADMAVINTPYIVYVSDDNIHIAAGIALEYGIDATYVEIQVLGYGDTVSVWELEKGEVSRHYALNIHPNDMSYTHEDYAQRVNARTCERVVLRRVA
jgi:hypothetical protein